MIIQACLLPPLGLQYSYPSSGYIICVRGPLELAARPLSKMHLLPLLFIIIAALDVSLASPQSENLLAADGSDGSLTSMESNLGDTAIPGSESSLFGSSDVFTATTPPSSDVDISLLLEDNAFALTDTTLQSACATQNSPTDGQSLFTRDGSSCLPPLNLAPGPLQLFQDPLGSLERILPAKDENSGPTNPEQKESGRNVGETSHDTNPVDDEAWRFSPGKVTGMDISDDPCQPYLGLGFIYGLCCIGAVQMAGNDPGLFAEYYWLAECDVNPGTWLTQSFFSIHLQLTKCSIGGYCARGNDVCCKHYVSDSPLSEP